MPTTGRTTGVVNIDGQISTNTGILNGKIASRLRVTPADIDLIKDTYNLFRLHSHQMYDLIYAAYPNTNPHPTSARTVTSTNVIGATDETYTVEFDDDDHGTMADNIFTLIDTFNNYAHVHHHEWDDASL